MNAKDEYDRLEAEHFAALNGIGRPVADDSELTGIKAQLQAQKQRCMEEGIAIVELETRLANQRAESLAATRAYARDAMRVIQMVPRRRRGIYAALAGALAQIGPMQFLHSHQVNLVLVIGAGLLASLITYVGCNVALAEFFPTAAIRIGRRAANENLPISLLMNLWPAASDGQRDYRFGYRMQYGRLLRAGRPSGESRVR